MTEERIASLSILVQQLDGSWQDLTLLDAAFMHRSFVNENPLSALQDNERLEFLGDAVLELCISHMLMQAFPSSSEGQLSKLRASLVNEQPLAELARRFHLGEYLLLGRGEEMSGGREKASLLANTLEAVVAALYLDRGFDKTLAFVSRLFTPLLADGTRELVYRDYKTALQEATQNRFREVPQYVLSGEQGPDHDKLFEVRLAVGGVLDVCGTGRNKKEAEQQAARKAMEILNESDILRGNDAPGGT
jgi:ribonuclease III